MKKLRIKKKFKIILLLIIILIIGGIYGFNKYAEYKYKQTYEYKFLEIGYTKDEIKILEDNFDNKKLDELLTLEKDELLLNIVNEKYYISKYFDKYYEYSVDNDDIELSKVIAIINTNTDEYFYENINNSNIEDNIAILVNKYYALPNDYVPALVSVSTKYAWGTEGSQKLTEEAYNAYLDMWNAAYNEKEIYLMINSSYRSFTEQESVYNDYKSGYGEKYADNIAARPGHSEHQTGLAMDLFSLQNPSRAELEGSDTYNWLIENSYKYGYILRYPKEKEDLTGYTFESWHYRYVGKDVAKYIYDNNITYDEYYAYYIENK